MHEKKKITLTISSTINKKAGKFARKLRRQNITRNNDGYLMQGYVFGSLPKSGVAGLASRRERRKLAKSNNEVFKPVYNN